MLIKHDELIDILTYEPDTGLFRWRKPRPKVRVGSVAGCSHHRGYVYIEISGKAYAAHRLAWFYVRGQWPKDQIDHINRNRSDNRIKNLREATHGQNRANSKHCNRNGFKGVTFKPWLKAKPYQAQITFSKKVIYLGCHATAELAHKAYLAAAVRLHGKFSNHGADPGASAKS